MRNLAGRPGTRTEGRYEENLSLRDTPSQIEDTPPPPPLPPSRERLGEKSAETATREAETSTPLCREVETPPPPLQMIFPRRPTLKVR
jgi:hypothetical protein